MTKLLGSLALLAALCLPAAAAETVLCRVSGYPAPTTCSTQPALLGSSLPVAPGTATAGVATFAAREDHRHPLQAKSYTLLTSGSGTYTVPANVTICDVSATGGGGGGGGTGAAGGRGGNGGSYGAGGGGGGGAQVGSNSGAGGNGASGHIEVVCW